MRAKTIQKVMQFLRIMRTPTTNFATRSLHKLTGDSCHYRKGHRAEIYAALSLTLKGYLILKRRYKTPVGEIDLIAKRGRYLIAVEVKARPSLQQGVEAITQKQQRRICQAMGYYRRRGRWKTLITRYDAIVVRPLCWPRHIIDLWRETY